MNEDTLVGIVVGCLIGFVGGVSLGAATEISHAQETRIFREEGKPAVMRIYRNGATDQLLVEEVKDVYKPLNDYLKKFEKPDNEIQERLIMKRAHWYE